MNVQALFERTLQPQDNPHRYDIYRQIHKALRAFMADTTTAVGRMDTDDDAEVARTLAQVRLLLELCRSHLQHENTFVHPAVEAGRLGAAVRVEGEHLQHGESIGKLESAVRGVESSAGSARAGAALQLYKALALFTADNFEHMHREETDHNAALWEAHSDAVLMEIEQAIVASIPPEKMGVTLRWMLPYMNRTDRAAMLAGMRAQAPAAVFAGVLELARTHLRAADWDKLVGDLKLDASALAQCA